MLCIHRGKIFDWTVWCFEEKVSSYILLSLKFRARWFVQSDNPRRPHSSLYIFLIEHKSVYKSYAQMFTAALVRILKNKLEPTHIPIYEWMNKYSVVYS